MFTPRYYQTECVDAVLKAKERGLSRVLYTQATGTGKTAVACNIIKDVRKTDDRPALFIAHRDELLQQAAQSIHRFTPGLHVSIERGPEKASIFSNVIVASIQTIGKSGSSRLQWLADIGPSVIIYDECHHIASDGAQRTIERFGAYDDRTFLAGATATDHRLDGKALVANGTEKHDGQATFQEKVYSYPLLKAIDDGFLCDIHGYLVQTKTDLSNVKTTAGDYNVKQLAAAVDTPMRTAAGLQRWIEVASNRPTIVFCVNVEHAKHAAEAWREAGYKADYVHGGMDRTERRHIIDQFKAGIIQVLANVEVASEGFDYPAISCVVMLRPTQSWVLYVQCAGRGSRLCEGKSDCIVIDVADNSTKHSLASAPTLLGLNSNLDLQGKSLTQAKKQLDMLGDQVAAIANFKPKTFAEIETTMKQVDLFRGIRPPDIVQQNSRHAWLLIPSPEGGKYTLSAGKRDDGKPRRAEILQDALGYSVKLVEGPDVIFQQRLPAEFPQAIKHADGVLDSTWPDSKNITALRSGWRGQPVTERQAYLLRQFKVSDDIIASLTKGDASGLIDQHFQRRAQGTRA